MFWFFICYLITNVCFNNFRICLSFWINFFLFLFNNITITTKTIRSSKKKNTKTKEEIKINYVCSVYVYVTIWLCLLLLFAFQFFNFNCKHDDACLNHKSFIFFFLFLIFILFHVVFNVDFCFYFQFFSEMPLICIIVVVVSLRVLLCLITSWLFFSIPFIVQDYKREGEKKKHENKNNNRGDILISVSQMGKFKIFKFKV